MKKTLILSSLLAAAAASGADGPFGDYSRANRWEVYLQGNYLTGGNTTESGPAELEFDSGFGGGIGIGYNISDHFNINSDIGGGTIDVEASAFGTTLKGDATTFNWNLNLDYNILKKRLTPFVTGGAGLLHFSGDFSGSEFSEWDFSWNVGGGVRWDFTDKFFAKAAYRATWAALQDADNITFFHGATVSVGLKF